MEHFKVIRHALPAVAAAGGGGCVDYMGYQRLQRHAVMGHTGTVRRAGIV